MLLTLSFAGTFIFVSYDGVAYIYMMYIWTATDFPRLYDRVCFFPWVSKPPCWGQWRIFLWYDQRGFVVLVPLLEGSGCQPYVFLWRSICFHFGFIHHISYLAFSSKWAFSSIPAIACLLRQWSVILSHWSICSFFLISSLSLADLFVTPNPSSLYKPTSS